jgi:hypothetical protein
VIGWAIRHWDGATWTDMTPSGIFGGLNDVWAAASDDVWVVGVDGLLLHYDGSTWTQVPSGTAASLLGVSGRTADDVWAVGLNGTLLEYDGVAWAPVASPLEADYWDVAVRGDVVVFAAWHLGLLALVREVGW